MSENLEFVVSELVVGSCEQDIYQQMIMSEIENLHSVKYTKVNSRFEFVAEQL